MSAPATHTFFPVGLTGTRSVAQVPPRVAAPDGVALLTRRLAEGDEAAFREVHAQYFDRLFQFLLVVARGDEHQAREAVQETFVRLARHARPFDREESFWCWLKVVARNAARDAGRKHSRYIVLLRNFALDTPTEAPIPHSVSDDRLGVVLQESLSEMDPADARLLTGKYLEGSSVRELSLHTGLTEKAIESRLLRLRRDLRERALKKLRSP